MAAHEPGAAAGPVDTGADTLAGVGGLAAAGFAAAGFAAAGFAAAGFAAAGFAAAGSGGVGATRLTVAVFGGGVGAAAPHPNLQVRRTGTDISASGDGRGQAGLNGVGVR